MSKSSKRRPCPAVQSEITPADCGEYRNSKHLCPAGCQFNPFAPANYSQLLEMEARFDQLAFQALVTEPIEGDSVQRRLDKIGYGNQGFSNVVLWEMFHRRSDLGLTFAQRWENRGLTELKNDLRNLHRAKSGMYLALLEIQTVVDADSLRCRDLFQPSRTPFLLFDRSAARRACRFDVLLGQCYDLPHFTRFFGTAISIPFMQTTEATTVVREIVSHLGGPTDLPAIQLWLLEHLNDFTDALWATSEARRQAALAAADLKQSKAVYRLAAPYAECRAALDRVTDVAPDRLSKEHADEGFSDARVWFASPEHSKARHNVGREALGTVLLGQAFWRLETITQDRMDLLRRQFETALGGRVRLEGVRVDELPQAVVCRNAATSNLVPPTLLIDIPQLSFSASRVSPLVAKLDPGSLHEQVLRSADESFLDDSIPALNGATPRTAAQDVRLVSMLRQLLKQRINGADRKNLSNGGRYDAAWVAAELGQTDLCTPPPPPRPRFNYEEPTHPEAELEHTGSDLTPAPPLPLHLDAETAANRIDEAFKAFPNALDLQEEAIVAGCTWFDDVNEFVGEKLSDAEFGAVCGALLQAWFVMVPLGYSGPELSLDHVTKRLARLSVRMKVDDETNALTSHLKSEFQSHIGGMATLSFLEFCKKSNLLKKSTSPKTILLIAVIVAFIDELHLALGGRSSQ